MFLAALSLMDNSDYFYSKIACHVNQAVFADKQLTYRWVITFRYYAA